MKTLTRFAFSKSTIAWLVLMLLTFLTWMFTIDAPFAKSVIAASVIVVAFVKVSVIGSVFMELQTAPIPMRIAFVIWATGSCGALIAIGAIGAK